MEQKVSVRNPLEMLNTPGQEVENIFAAQGRDVADFMPIDKLRVKVKFSEKEIARLCKVLGMGDELASFIRNYQDDYACEKKKAAASYKVSKKAFTKLKDILPLLRNEFTEGKDVLDDILDYFDVDSEEEVFSASDNFAALFRRQNNVEVDPVNLYAWLRRGELDFNRMNLPEYNEAALNNWIDSGKWKHQIENPDYFHSLPSVMESFGVALVLVPYLPKTVYGCVRWFDGKPLIQISDRNRDLATCWFTLFHELGHVILHRNEEILEGQLNESNVKLSEIERQANKFANSYLFNGDQLRKTVFERKRRGESMTAYSLSDEFKVHHLFTSYWLLKAQYQPTFQRHVSIDFLSQY
ncbi:MAG: ImmA/IrrE family metallo-endopeptidase [Candidatus Limisoma sp.]